MRSRFFAACSAKAPSFSLALDSTVFPKVYLLNIFIANALMNKFLIIISIKILNFFIVSEYALSNVATFNWLIHNNCCL